jgi:hypothetical protein
MVNLTARGKRVAGVSLQRTANQLMVLISHHVPHTEKTKMKSGYTVNRNKPKTRWARPKLLFIVYLTTLLVLQITHAERLVVISLSITSHCDIRIEKGEVQTVNHHSIYISFNSCYMFRLM